MDFSVGGASVPFRYICEIYYKFTNKNKTIFFNKDVMEGDDRWRNNQRRLKTKCIKMKNNWNIKLETKSYIFLVLVIPNVAC